jgi:hypothetical protein
MRHDSLRRPRRRACIMAYRDVRVNVDGRSLILMEPRVGSRPIFPPLVPCSAPLSRAATGADRLHPTGPRGGRTCLVSRRRAVFPIAVRRIEATISAEFAENRQAHRPKRRWVAVPLRSGQATPFSRGAPAATPGSDVKRLRRTNPARARSGRTTQLGAAAGVPGTRGRLHSPEWRDDIRSCLKRIRARCCAST